jgi:hypothetical protein
MGCGLNVRGAVTPPNAASVDASGLGRGVARELSGLGRGVARELSGLGRGVARLESPAPPVEVPGEPFTTMWIS